MTSGWKSILLTVVLAAVASGGGAWLGASWMMKRDQPLGVHDIVHQKLNLSAEQNARLDDIEARFSVRRQALEAQVRQANRELAAAISASKGDTPEVYAAVDHFHDAMGGLQKATIAHVFEMRSVLTDEQARIFDREIAGALTQERQ
ncbi:MULTISPECIES: Spy/CpxP family protein refolding chaperone [unclassified Brevundimonas]|uniref:Spy/CpxP family protein refolding chaperone n=1 Tax=unclassified Brevundimonas TaxID=2622653 RepID=UPI0025BA57AE|nr:MULTISPECIES: periplasmic heavy metal sensor [unclassified Brevundimonas]